jgi:hypothetical protein
MSHSRSICRTLDSGQQISTPRRRTGTGAGARTSRPTWKLDVHHIAQACARHCPYRIADRCRETALRGTPGRPHGLPGCPRSEVSHAEDCGRLVICFSFPKHHLGGEAGSEEFLSGITTTFATQAGLSCRNGDACEIGDFLYPLPQNLIDRQRKYAAATQAALLSALRDKA